MADITDATFQAPSSGPVPDRSGGRGPVGLLVRALPPSPPILDKVIAQTDGAVESAKVDIEKNPAVAQGFRVQSIPAVYAMVDGEVADGFLGAQGEAAVREFVQRLRMRSHAHLTLADDDSSRITPLPMASMPTTLRSTTTSLSRGWSRSPPTAIPSTTTPTATSMSRCSRAASPGESARCAVS